MSARLLVVALDAADGALLEEMSAAGTLPHLAGLRQRGHFHRLPRIEMLSDDSLWASFQYGLGEAGHGRHFYQVVNRHGRTRRPNRSEDGTGAFWHGLARDGHRVAVLDIPKCAPPVPFDGIHLADWLVHGRYSTVPVSHPPELADEVLARFGPPPPSRCGYHQSPLDDEEVRRILANLLLSVERKRAAALHYLETEAWDLFLVGFKEAHCAGHGLWHLADPAHAEYDPAAAARLGDPVRQVYQALDGALGALLDAAGPGTELVVFSTTDMMPNGAVRHLVPEIAARLDRRLRRLGGWRHGLRALPARRRQAMQNEPEVIRALPSNENIVAFDLVRPEERRSDALLDAAEALLRELVDPATGKRAFIGFSRPARDQAGARAAMLPDLVAHCRPNTFPAALASAELGHIEAAFERMRPGNHLGGGAVFAAGPCVEAAAEQVQAMQDFAGLITGVLQAQNIRAAE